MYFLTEKSIGKYNQIKGIVCSFVIEIISDKEKGSVSGRKKDV